MQVIKRDSDNKTIYTPVRSIFDEFFRFPLMDDPFFTSPVSIKGVSADVWEEGDNVFVKMAVPGVKEDDLKVTVENDMVTISASQKSEEKSDENKRYYYKSISSSFEQSFNLPCKVDANKASAKLNDGIVTITLPKSEEQKAKEIKISK